MSGSYMAFNDLEQFSRRYKSLASLGRAIGRQRSQGHSFSAEGHAAKELMELIAIGASVTLGTTLVGAQIGGFFGPTGVPVGAGIGAVVGLVGSYYAIEWYVSVKLHRDGTITATFAPA